MTEKKYLHEVVFIRLALIVLLVMTHAFAPYSGAWEPLSISADIPFYKYLHRFISAFRLEMFAALSGYLLGYQAISLDKHKKFGKFALRRFKRIVITSIAFSILYVILFRKIEIANILPTIYSILAGAGHLWFLPMIFWCSLGGWLLIKWKTAEKYKFMLLLAISILSVLPLPLQLNTACYYLLFFYGGAWTYKNASRFAGVTLLHLLLAWIVFIAMLVLSWFVGDSLPAGDTMLSKVVGILFSKYSRMLYAVVGSLALYASCVFLLKKIKFGSFAIKLSGYCYGIYIFQQFFLVAIYYRTNFCEYVGVYWLPWLSFVIALMLSVLLASVFVKTRVGRFLIG